MDSPPGDCARLLNIPAVINSIKIKLRFHYFSDRNIITCDSMIRASVQSFVFRVPSLLGCPGFHSSLYNSTLYKSCVFQRRRRFFFRFEVRSSILHTQKYIFKCFFHLKSQKITSIGCASLDCTSYSGRFTNSTGDGHTS